MALSFIDGGQKNNEMSNLSSKARPPFLNNINLKCIIYSRLNISLLPRYKGYEHVNVNHRGAILIIKRKGTSISSHNVMWYSFTSRVMCVWTCRWFSLKVVWYSFTSSVMCVWNVSVVQYKSSVVQLHVSCYVCVDVSVVQYKSSVVQLHV